MAETEKAKKQSFFKSVRAEFQKCSAYVLRI